MTQSANYDALFSGVIGQEYEMLKLICPLMTEMSRMVGEAVRDFPRTQDKLNVVELGGGTGITTLALLTAGDGLHITSIDNEPTMQDQAKQNLKAWEEEGRLTFNGQDALSALQAMPPASVDMVASAYTLHNFLDSYRQDVIRECYRVLKPGGQFINGDRYAFDDISRHTRVIQEEVAGYFKVLTEINRLDLLEHWIVHLFSDESENHVMRQSNAIRQLHEAGFSDISISDRMAVNALVKAVKPFITN
ncbi:methyltransferase type 11 [Methyloglobulus morosus KoM1]|uniref:Methyltransferase type 11 n=1 Tax=Methyloglobulus morosus KoM1 TaxID=1116472 RepID=V5C8Z5_9GAMM|nr:class I SAM-dependent methyltransferase [Methyloglobulus morosus]ESS73218.1 methyltransferase type 11 [Methyloglobulus morosus KoM1]